MPRKDRTEESEARLLVLWDHYLEQLPTLAALLWEDGTAEDAAAHAVEIIEASFKEAERLERP